jgi:Ca2+-binding RTX toxin-like protein
VANFGGNNASILLNTTTTGATTPTFATKVDFAAGTGSQSVSIGDFNGDGKPDLAVANFGGNNASILLNTTATGATTPTFATKVDFPTGAFPVSVSIGDFNGDDKPDLATANNLGNTASILLNTTTTGATTPTFATKVDFATGNLPFSVSIGDINGDGKPDLAVANNGSNNASILLNTTTTGATTPTFATKVDFDTGSAPFSVSIGDINGDGKPDLAVANTISNSASILLNTTTTGATTPTFATKVDFPTGTQPRSVSIGDINGDGKPDLAVANTNSGNASILLNTTTTGATTPTFATKVDFATGTRPSSVSIGDFNGDGKPDLAVANNNSNNASILLNNSPKVTAVTATTADGSYGVGATIKITVTFDAAVNVTGTPQLQLETGTTDRFATYAGGSGTTTLTFDYVVQAGDSSVDLEYLSTTALTLNGGTIKETAATAGDAFLTLPTLATANSLGGSKAIVIDTVAPTVALSSTAAATVNAPFAVTATFTEDVTGFDATDITVGNGTASNFATVDAKTYTFDVTPTADGNVTVDIAASSATDTAGNNNSAATQLTRTADITAPTVALSSTAATTVNAPFAVTATFTEDVTGFDATDITVGNGTASNFTTVDAKTYTFDVTPTADGNVTVDIAASSATDTAGNNNTAATQLTRTADITAPTVTLSSTAAATVNAPFAVTATFTEDVTGFDATDITVGNGTASNFTTVDAKTYTFDVTPTADGNVTVDIAANSATDSVGNNNTAATQLTRTYDTVAPTVALSSTAATTVNAPFAVTATFTEDVTGFDATDITVGNGTASNFTTVDAKTYTFDVTPTADGNVTVDIAANSATDTAGNNNSAATQLTRTADITAPTVALSSTAAATVNAPFAVTATFTEDVTGFGATDITVGNGTASNFTTVDAKTYTFDVTPTADGNVTVDIAASSATDTAGNNNTAATQLTRTADITAPTVALSSTAADTVNAPFAVTATFTEDVTGFDATDITVGNGTASNFTTVDAKTYTFDVTPTADGNVTVDIAANSATDTAGNNNSAATQLTRTADITAPTVALSSTAADTVNGTFSVTATFSETVTDFLAADIVVNNGDVSNLQTTDNITYTFDVTPTADGTVTVDIAANLATDSAGNHNSVATQLIRTADITAPDAPTISTSGTTDDNTPDIAGTAEANSTVTLFQNGIEIGNVAADADGNWTFTLATAIDDGTYEFTATATDAVGNTSDVSAASSLMVDTTVDQPEDNPAADNTTDNPATDNPATDNPATDNTTDNPATDNPATDNPATDNPATDNPATDNTPDTGVVPVAPAPTSEIPPFTGLNNIQASDDTSDNQTDNSSLPVPPPIPPFPTVDLANISFTAVGTDGADNIDGQPTADVISGLAANDYIRGLQSNDALFGNEGNDEIYGNQGADLLNGNSGSDIIYSGQGNDIAFGGQDNDLMYGDLGSDSLSGDLGDDTLFGGPSNPDLVSGDAGDLLLGGDGNDYLQGNVGNDSISGGTGNDIAYGGQGNDLIHGDEGADIIYGDKGNDSLTGNADNDVVYGGEGNDFLWGGTGDDFLYGDAGNDTLIGNDGTDYFAIQSGFGSDEVLDFIDGTDLIGLAGGLTFADLSITGNNGNTFISSGNELLATLTGVDVGLITNADFTVLV